MRDDEQIEVVRGRPMASARVARTPEEIAFMRVSFEQWRREREDDILDNLTRTQALERCSVCHEPMTESEEDCRPGVCIGCTLVAELKERGV